MEEVRRCVYCGRAADDCVEEIEKYESDIRSLSFILHTKGKFEKENSSRRENNLPELTYEEFVELDVKKSVDYYKETLISTEKVYYYDKKTGEHYYDYAPVCSKCKYREDVPLDEKTWIDVD